MKIKSFLLIIVCFISSTSAMTQTWSEWFEQKKTQRKYLLEQIAKLQIYLGYAKKGYNIAKEGLNLIGDIKNGDFNLHSFFFDRLKVVSPAIKRYTKVGDIVSMQQKMLAAYKTRYKKIKESGRFIPDEIDYIYGIFSCLFDGLTEDMEALTILLTDGQLEMQDNERLKKIDNLHDDVTEKYSSFFSFVNRITTLARQREHELNDLQNLQKLY